MQRKMHFIVYPVEPHNTGITNSVNLFHKTKVLLNGKNCLYNFFKKLPHPYIFVASITNGALQNPD